ncbi:MAG: PaaI family thioesterase [Alphaproteobacteria bacterium]|nr:PaaI family thioesterase [Alphaproteobacteria bacterium]
MGGEEQIYRVAWVPHEVNQDAYASLSGLDVLRKVVDGSLPHVPYAAIIGIRLVEVESGYAVFATEPAEHLYNPLGTVHGGVAASLIDSATGCAVYATLGAQDKWTTLELKVNYVRAMTEAVGEVRCTGTIIHAGGSIVTAEARVTDREGRLYAHGNSTILVKRAANGNR